jgi:hypothetical protein
MPHYVSRHLGRGCPDDDDRDEPLDTTAQHTSISDPPVQVQLLETPATVPITLVLIPEPQTHARDSSLGQEQGNPRITLESENLNGQLLLPNFGL